MTWTDLPVGEIYSFNDDANGNLWMKCTAYSMCLVRDNGGTRVWVDRDTQLCTGYGQCSDLLTI